MSAAFFSPFINTHKTTRPQIPVFVAELLVSLFALLSALFTVFLASFLEA